ncbi:MAG TPA: LysR family transcriptional regulator [Polyangia bacterium]
MHDAHPGLDLPLLLALEALIEERSVTRAAARLSRGQPAMSHALRRLRASLSDPVLVRTSAGMTPTPRALALAARIGPALRALRTAMADPPAFDAATAERTFTIATRDYTEVVLLPALLDELRREAPGIRVRLVPLGEALPVEDLEAGRADLAIGYFGAVPGTLRHQVLLREGFACVMAEEHPASRRPLTLERYCRLRHLHVTPSGGGRGLVDELLDRRGRKRTIVLEIPDFVAVPLICARTDLVATIPRRIAEALGGTVPIAATPSPFTLEGFPVAQVWSPHLHADPGHRWLRRTIARLLGGPAASGSEKGVTHRSRRGRRGTLS